MPTLRTQHIQYHTIPASHTDSAPVAYCELVHINCSIDFHSIMCCHNNIGQMQGFIDTCMGCGAGE